MSQCQCCMLFPCNWNFINLYSGIPAWPSSSMKRGVLKREYDAVPKLPNLLLAGIVHQNIFTKEPSATLSHNRLQLSAPIVYNLYAQNVLEPRPLCYNQAQALHNRLCRANRTVERLKINRYERRGHRGLNLTLFKLKPDNSQSYLDHP